MHLGVPPDRAVLSNVASRQSRLEVFSPARRSDHRNKTENEVEKHGSRKKRRG
jgi:hypothetical protein